MDDLLSAYLKYAKSLGFKSDLIFSDNGHATIKIIGNNVWKAFRYEPGKHCVQRIPPTESKGRAQTSIVSVAVLPIPPKIGTKLKSSDLKIERVNLGGKGGQHQNKTLSGCRMTHIPTGLKATINGRDYHSNEREAKRILAARVQELKQSKANANYSAKRVEQLGGGGRSDKVRTYNFIKSRVVDHNLGTKTRNIKQVMKGNFELLLK